MSPLDNYQSRTDTSHSGTPHGLWTARSGGMWMHIHQIDWSKDKLHPLAG
jgi:hypothetical protein